MNNVPPAKARTRPEHFESPLGYGPIEPLRLDTWLRLLPPGHVPPMAATLQAAPLALDEFAQAVAHYPIVVVSNPGGVLVPAALLSLRPGRNAFVVRNVRVTRWTDGVYVPAYLRRWPLCTATVSAAPETARSAAPRPTICVECTRQTAGAITGSVRLFTADGTPTDRGHALITWLEDYDAALARSRDMALLWQDLGLLQAASWQAPVTETPPAVHLSPHMLHGLWTVDPAALTRLGPAAIAELHRRQMIAATHLAAESDARFADLYERTLATATHWRGALPSPRTSSLHSSPSVQPIRSRSSTEPEPATPSGTASAPAFPRDAG
jgi:hypothetical protein